jgi:group I intron endonuclease
MTVNTGIYRIYNLLNGKSYVGRSKNCMVRFRNHRSDFKRGIHHSAHLQRSWNKYGQDSFKFEVIESCSKEMLAEREVYWVRLLKSDDPKYGYNVDKADEIGDRMVHTDSVCESIRASKVGELNYTSKLTWDTVWEIRERYTKGSISQHQLAEEYGVSRSAILLNNTWVSAGYAPHIRIRGSWAIGRSLSEETKKKIGDANRSKKNPEL